MSLNIRRDLPKVLPPSVRPTVDPAVRSWDLRVVTKVHRFMNAVSEPAPLFAMALAGPAFSLVRNPVLSFLLSKSPAFWTRSLGVRMASAAAALPGEVLVFGAAERAAKHVLHRGPQDWRLETLAQEAGALGLTLALFKMHGRMAQYFLPKHLLRWRPWVAGLGMYSGIVHSQIWGERLIWRERTTWSELLGRSLETFLQLKTMGYLSVQAMGRRYQNWVANLEARAEQALKNREILLPPMGTVRELSFAGSGVGFRVALPRRGSRVDAKYSSVYSIQGRAKSELDSNPHFESGEWAKKKSETKASDGEMPLFHDWSLERIQIMVEQASTPHVHELVRRINAEKDPKAQARLQNILTEGIRTYRENREKLGIGDDLVRGNPSFRLPPVR